jgi:hypothetical protein
MNFYRQNPDFVRFSETLKQGIWFLGVACWLFGITDRSLASFADGYLSAIEIMQLFTATFFFACWLLLKPYTTMSSEPSRD